MSSIVRLLAALVITSAALDIQNRFFAGHLLESNSQIFTASTIEKPLNPNTPIGLRKLIDGMKKQIGVTTIYDAAYRNLSYPNGDVPIERGVCSDVVVRAFRKSGIDLQKAVHEDLSAHFSQYPRKWGLKSPDKNIDHRRVPNLQTFFNRSGKTNRLH